ncbi:protein DPCD [Phlebotomus argentipes]|uniref:protein DPCD n=1 Tax=Phlebotomus argentipes TaxID=94469 RepID=UPI0028934CF7|nr:protein DPCD [Phlebotomus argentipes]
MSFAEWLNLIRTAEKTSMIGGNQRKIHYTFLDGREMVEEYSLETGIIQKRAWRKKKELRGEPDWEIELGDCVKDLRLGGEFLLKESNTEPILTKRITKTNIEWRIRNLPYPVETYSILADCEKNSIIVRTSNKKYFKVIQVPELQRCNSSPKQENISFKHQHNTLIIQYQKPKILLDMEKAVLLELKDVETTTDLDVDCDELLQQLMGK